MFKSFMTRSSKLELKYFIIVKNPLLNDSTIITKVNPIIIKNKKIKYSLL